MSRVFVLLAFFFSALCAFADEPSSFSAGEGDNELYGYEKNIENPDGTRKTVVVVEPKFRIGFSFKNGLAKVLLKEGGYRFIRPDGSYAFEASFHDAGDFAENGLASVKDKKSGLWGFINKSGDFVIQPQFDSLGSLEPTFDWTNEDKTSALAAVRQRGGKVGFINAKGDMVIPYMFDYAYGFDKFGQSIVEVNEKQGIIDLQGKFVVEPKYYHIGMFWYDGGYYYPVAPVELSRSENTPMASALPCINRKGEELPVEKCNAIRKEIDDKEDAKNRPRDDFSDGELIAILAIAVVVALLLFVGLPYGLYRIVKRSRSRKKSEA
jgi:hypothetical protein